MEKQKNFQLLGCNFYVDFSLFNSRRVFELPQNYEAAAKDRARDTLEKRDRATAGTQGEDYQETGRALVHERLEQLSTDLTESLKSNKATQEYISHVGTRLGEQIRKLFKDDPEKQRGLLALKDQIQNEFLQSLQKISDTASDAPSKRLELITKHISTLQDTIGREHSDIYDSLALTLEIWQTLPQYQEIQQKLDAAVGDRLNEFRWHLQNSISDAPSAQGYIRSLQQTFGIKWLASYTGSQKTQKETAVRNATDKANTDLVSADKKPSERAVIIIACLKNIYGTFAGNPQAQEEITIRIGVWERIQNEEQVAERRLTEQNDLTDKLSASVGTKESAKGYVDNLKTDSKFLALLIKPSQLKTDWEKAMDSLAQKVTDERENSDASSRAYAIVEALKEFYPKLAGNREAQTELGAKILVWERVATKLTIAEEVKPAAAPTAAAPAKTQEYGGKSRQDGEAVKLSDRFLKRNKQTLLTALGLTTPSEADFRRAVQTMQLKALEKYDLDPKKAPPTPDERKFLTDGIVGPKTVELLKAVGIDWPLTGDNPLAAIGYQKPAYSA